MQIASDEYFFGVFADGVMSVYGLTTGEKANVYDVTSGAFSRDVAFSWAQTKWETACEGYDNVTSYVIADTRQDIPISNPEQFATLPLE